MKLIVSVSSFFFFILSVNASGDGAHHGSVADLLAPAVNVGILAVFLGIKLKKIMKNSFDQKSKNIKEIMERASVKAKEATALLEEQERKVANLDGEVRRIFEENEKEIKNFEAKINKETDEKISKFEEDTKHRLSAEKNGLVLELQNSYLLGVLSKVESQIKNDKGLQKKVEDKLLKGLNV